MKSSRMEMSTMSIITLYKISTSDKSSYNWNDIYFQNGNKLNFHVRYAKKINRYFP